jgi:hypothetical protein
MGTFTELYPLAVTTRLAMLVRADPERGVMTISVMPRPMPDTAAKLVTDLTLTATPEDFDAASSKRSPATASSSCRCWSKLWLLAAPSKRPIPITRSSPRPPPNTQSRQHLPSRPRNVQPPALLPPMVKTTKPSTLTPMMTRTGTG